MQWPIIRFQGSWEQNSIFVIRTLMNCLKNNLSFEVYQLTEQIRTNMQSDLKYLKFKLTLDRRLKVRMWASKYKYDGFHRWGYTNHYYYFKEYVQIEESRRKNVQEWHMNRKRVTFQNKTGDDLKNIRKNQSMKFFVWNTTGFNIILKVTWNFWINLSKSSKMIELLLLKRTLSTMWLRDWYSGRSKMEKTFKRVPNKKNEVVSEKGE